MAKAFRIFALVGVLSLLLLAIPLPLANVAIANGVTEVWVATTGSDSNPGTQAQPFATIQKGIDTLELGDGGTVHVAAGTYYENLLISKAVNLTGAGAQNTIIDGAESGHVIVISSAPDTENIISGFTIQNGRYAASLWNPTDEQVMYAGLNLRFLRMLPQPSAILLGGGGILIGETHIVYLNDCVIKNNISQRGGGITNTGQLHMNRCTVSSNTATDQGGGIFNYYNPMGPGDSGRMWLTDCTISGNQVTEFDFSGGGGIYNQNGVMELLNCTIAYNSTSSFSGTAGGGFYNFADDTIPDLHTAYFQNTIVADNTAGDDSSNNGSSYPDGATVSQGNNLDSENSCGFNQTTDLINTDPLLGPLQDNGGPTFTHALLEGSPAIDAGTCTGAPATDQRGVTRPQGENCDIGAFELEYEAAIPQTTGPRSSPSIPTPPRPLNPPQMSLQYVSVNPQQTTAGQPVTITTNVVNTGDEAGNINITLTINGQVEQSRMVSVGPQGTQPVEFTVTKAQPGTYNVNILNKSGSFTILGSGGTTSAPVNSGLIILLIVGVLVVATVLILILSRRPA